MKKLIFESSDSFIVYQFQDSHSCLYLLNSNRKIVLCFEDMLYFEMVNIFVHPKIYLVSHEDFEQNLNREKFMGRNLLIMEDLHGSSRICTSKLSILELNSKFKHFSDFISHDWKTIL
jgi:hypothetical protein